MQPKSRTPISYERVTWHCTLPADAAGGVIGLAFSNADGVKRLAVDLMGAQHLLETLADALGYELQPAMGVQSPGSALMPSLPRAVPSDGGYVAPCAASAAALAKLL